MIAFMMSCESRFSQWLVEDISYLMLRGRSFDDYIFSLHVLTEVVVRLVYVLGSQAYLGETRQFQCSTIVFKNVHCILGCKSSMLMPCARASVRSPINGMTSLRQVESAMYSASVVDMAVMVCILDAHVMGVLAKRTIHPNPIWLSLDQCVHPPGASSLRNRHPPSNQTAWTYWGV